MRKKISVDQCNNRDGDRSNWTYNILIYDLEYEKKKKKSEDPSLHTEIIFHEYNNKSSSIHLVQNRK